MKPPGRTFHFFRIFFFAYPLRSVMMLTCFLIASLLEAVAFANMVPLLSLIGGDTLTGDNLISRSVKNGLDIFGLQPSIETLLTAIVLAVIISAVFQLIAMKEVGYSAAHVTADLRLSLLRSIIKARWDYFTSQRTGLLSIAIEREAHRAANGYVSACRVIAGIIQVGIYAGLAFVVSWELTLAACFVGALIIRLLSGMVRMAREAGQQETKLSRAFTARLIDILNGMKTLKAMASEDRGRVFLESQLYGLQQAQQQIVFSREAQLRLHGPLAVIALGIGVYILIVTWKVEFTSVAVLMLLFIRTVQRISQLPQDYQKVVASESAFWSYRETKHQADAAREETGQKQPRLNRAIAFREVTFAYGEKTVFNNASFIIPLGKFVIITGQSGSGKTTIADLIVGLLRPQNGEIWIDDTPLAEVDIWAWRRMIGYIPQDIFLFHDSIMANVTLEDPGLKQADVEQALKDAGAWQFVATLPDGVRSLVGEKGGKLSGGQRQRIAIARALVRKPVLLILDEATTALDPKTESEICKTLRDLAGKLTVLAISHQSAMVEAADIVYELSDGSIRPARHSG